MTRDSLTALLNRRESMRRLQEEVLRCQRYGNKLCVALLDLDRFKRINDTYGHAVGDRVIKHFSLQLKNSLRDGDIIGRIGGEEFMVVLPETTLAVARRTFERLAEELRENPFSDFFLYIFWRAGTLLTRRYGRCPAGAGGRGII